LPRQQTLRATVEWSYSLLNAAEQSLFRRLSVFADGFDLEAAEAVCALGDLEVFELDDLLGSLVDKSLVLAEPFAGALRYRLLETIRQFAAERLVDHDEPQAVALAAAHRAHYLALAERAAPQVTRRDQARWLSVLDAEQANLRRALEHAAAGDDGTSDVLRLVAALGRYWLIRVRADEVRSVLPLLEGTAGPEPRLLGKALISASLCVRHVEPAISRELAIRAVELARRLEDDQLLAESLWMLCATFYFAGDIAGADLAGSESVELARRLGDDQLLGESLAMLILPRSCSDPVGAWQLYAEAIACVERSGDRFLEALLRNNAGVHELAAGNLAAARSHLEAAHRAWEEVGSNVHHAALNLGWVFREEGDAARAAAMFEQARRVSRRSGDRHGIAYARLGLACLAADSGDGYQAGVLHGSAAALLASLGEPFVQPEEGYRLASLAALADQLGVGELERALAEGAALGVEGGELAPAAGHSPTIVTQRART
jgi:tetratricopeptide (TPR) repeat protein